MWETRLDTGRKLTLSLKLDVKIRSECQKMNSGLPEQFYRRQVALTKELKCERNFCLGQPGSKIIG